MLFSSLVLLLIAAGLHAGANALLKQAGDKLAFAWWMLGVFCVLGSPAILFVPRVPMIAWWIVITSGLLEAIYFVTLTRAYTQGDLSMVYPVARGSAPLFLLIWAILFLHERPSAAGYAGIFSIVCGLYLINIPSLAEWSRPLRGFRSSASRWALLTGVLISGYTAIDKVGVRYFPPFVYLYFILLVCWLALALQWFSSTRRPVLKTEMGLAEDPRRKRRLLTVAAASLIGTGAYLLVLAAMKLSPVSYVGPVREVSVVIGAWIGVRFLNEKGGRVRILGSALIASGIVLIALAG